MHRAAVNQSYDSWSALSDYWETLNRPARENHGGKWRAGRESTRRGNERRMCHFWELDQPPSSFLVWLHACHHQKWCQYNPYSLTFRWIFDILLEKNLYKLIDLPLTCSFQGIHSNYSHTSTSNLYWFQRIDRYDSHVNMPESCDSFSSAMWLFYSVLQCLLRRTVSPGGRTFLLRTRGLTPHPPPVSWS